MQVFVVMECSCYGDELIDVFASESSAYEFCTYKNDNLPDGAMARFNYFEKELQE